MRTIRHLLLEHAYETTKDLPGITYLGLSAFNMWLDHVLVHREHACWWELALLLFGDNSTCLWKPRPGEQMTSQEAREALAIVESSWPFAGVSNQLLEDLVTVLSERAGVLESEVKYAEDTTRTASRARERLGQR